MLYTKNTLPSGNARITLFTLHNKVGDSGDFLSAKRDCPTCVLPCVRHRHTWYHIDGALVSTGWYVVTAYDVPVFKPDKQRNELTCIVCFCFFCYILYTLIVESYYSYCMRGMIRKQCKGKAECGCKNRSIIISKRYQWTAASMHIYLVIISTMMSSLLPKLWLLVIVYIAAPKLQIINTIIPHRNSLTICCT